MKTKKNYNNSKENDDQQLYLISREETFPEDVVKVIDRQTIIYNKDPHNRCPGCGAPMCFDNCTGAYKCNKCGYVEGGK